jgi:hypothetical protein
MADRVPSTVPQPTDWQRIGNQIDAAMIVAGPDFVNVHTSVNREFCLRRKQIVRDAQNFW